MYKEALAKFQSEHPGYKVIFLHKAGSYLYGTSTPNSDIDYRGLFVPTQRDVLCKKDIYQWSFNTADKNTKNGKDDLDLTLWNVHKFLGMLQGGDTNAFDTLFAYNSHAEEFSTEEMSSVFDNAKYLFPTSLKSFFGYALTQVKKYSIKGDKLKDVESVLDYLKKLQQDLTKTTYERQTLSVVKTELPNTDKLKWVSDENGIEYYEVLGKKFVQNMKLPEFEERVLEIKSTYGMRAKASMENGYDNELIEELLILKAKII